MTNEQIKQHLDRVVKTAKDIAARTCSQQWENYKKSRVENGERPIPEEMEESIRDVFTFAYATGIATGVEDTKLQIVSLYGMPIKEIGQFSPLGVYQAILL